MEFKLDQSSPIPLYAQIEAYLRNLMQGEEYAKGGKLLPKEVALSKKLGVSRNTIRQAINQLVNEGLVERKKGVGTKVVTKKISTRLDNWISFTNEMRSKGVEVVDYYIAIELTRATAEVYQALGVTEGKDIWKLEKIRGSKKGKFLYSISYFHPRVGITGLENFKKPLYELLETEHDIIVSTSKERLKAITANRKISEALGIYDNHAVLERERLVLDVGDRPVEFNKVYYHTDYFTYDIDIKREL